MPVLPPPPAAPAPALAFGPSTGSGAPAIRTGAYGAAREGPAISPVARRLDEIAHRADWLERRPPPLAGDGLPLWNPDDFQDRETPAPEGAASGARPRRASLRHPVEPLSIDLRLGHATVGGLLRGYAELLWRIRQRELPRRGVARHLRLWSVWTLGGPRSLQGALFQERCRRISRFTLDLRRVCRRSLQDYPARHALLVHERCGHALERALPFLLNGQAVPGGWRSALRQDIRCHVDRSQMFWWLDRLWSRFWC